MRITAIAVASLLGLLAVGRPVAAQAPRFVVIVNAANPTNDLNAREVSRIFRKEVTRWKGGSAILPVELPVDAEPRADFSQRVHGKPPQALVSYWQQQIFSGRSVPPVERKSDADVVEYVRTHPDAIGYVAAGASLPREVKAVTLR